MPTKTNMAERQEVIEAYGLAAVGLAEGLVVEGYDFVKGFIGQRRAKAGHNASGLRLVETVAEGPVPARELSDDGPIAA